MREYNNSPVVHFVIYWNERNRKQFYTLVLEDTT